jgi:hypothetical protein
LTSFYLRGAENITWGPASDTIGHIVNYSISYSLNNGSSWNLIDEKLLSPYYLWDTTPITINQYTLLKVEAFCEDGLSSSDINDESFAIANVPHSLSTPSFLNPSTGEHVGGNVEIQWEPAVDSWYLPVTYRLYFLNYQSEWELVENATKSTSFIWDTTPYEEGEMTLLVLASNYEGVEVNATSGVFIIDNIPDEKKIPGFPVISIMGFAIFSICALIIIFSRQPLQS